MCVVYYYRSEGLDPNGICYPCVMGWGLAGTGNSSAAVAAVPQNVFFGGNGFLRERVEYERSRRDTTAILIVRTLRFFLWTLEKSENPQKSPNSNTAVTFLGFEKKKGGARGGEAPSKNAGGSGGFGGGAKPPNVRGI